MGNLSEPVPRADIQAIIAAENPIPDQWAKLQWNGAFQLDGQIRNTAARVEPMRSCDRAGRARFDATLARAAAIGDWLIRRQFQRRQDLGQKEPRPKPFID